MENNNQSTLNEKEILLMAEKIQANQLERENFSKKIDEYLNNTLTTVEPIHVGKTSNALALAGADINLDVVINIRTIKKCMGDASTTYHGHELGKDVMEQLPSELQNPIMIFKGAHNDSLVVITSLIDDKNKSVIVAIDLNASSARHEVNRVTSVYGKNNIHNYLKNQLDNENLIACNEKEANVMLQSLGLQLPQEETFISFSDSISYTMKNVKYPDVGENQKIKEKENSVMGNISQKVNDNSLEEKEKIMIQAEKLIDSLEANKTLFRKEERNLIVNYSYKFDDMAKTRELAEKLVDAIENGNGSRMDIARKAEAEIDALPDGTVGLSEMHEYGYEWSEMLPLTQERAIELYKNDVTVYQLHADGTEAVIEDMESLLSHNGMFGVEKNEWNRYLDSNKMFIKADRTSLKNPNGFILGVSGSDEHQFEQEIDSASIQAEKLIDSLEANKTLFRKEERNLIVNYSYKFDDMAKTRELAEKLVDAIENGNGSRMDIARKAEAEIDALPDGTVGLSEMHEYGYEGSEMLPLTQERAIELYKDDVTVYQLHADGTEAVVEDMESLSSHNGMFGVEKNEWNTYLEHQFNQEVERNIDQHEAEYGADGFRAFPQENVFEPDYIYTLTVFERESRNYLEQIDLEVVCGAISNKDIEILNNLYDKYPESVCELKDLSDTETIIATYNVVPELGDRINEIVSLQPLSVSQQLSKWVNDYNEPKIIMENEARVLLDYVEGHDYKLATDVYGNLVRVDINSEETVIDDYSVDELLETTRKWNGELIENKVSEMEKLQFIPFPETDPEYVKLKGELESLRKDEAVLDKISLRFEPKHLAILQETSIMVNDLKQLFMDIDYDEPEDYSIFSMEKEQIVIGLENDGDTPLEDALIELGHTYNKKLSDTAYKALDTLRDCKLSYQGIEIKKIDLGIEEKKEPHRDEKEKKGSLLDKLKIKKIEAKHSSSEKQHTIEDKDKNRGI